MNPARRTRRSVAWSLAACLAVVAVAGCSTAPSARSSAAGGTAAEKTSPAALKIGVLPTEDSLPLFVAEQKGLFKKAGLDVTLVSFPAAAERDAALTAGSIDGAAADIIAAALLTSRGFPMRIVTLELGATPEQGRFGLLAARNSGLTSVKDLVTKGPLAQSSGTLAAYAADRMLTAAGVDPKTVKRSEIKKLPVRFDLLDHGQVPAAVLPEPLLSLGEKQGLKLLADDTKGANVSQTVLMFSDKYLRSPGGSQAVEALLRQWNAAVADIDISPDSWRALLVEKARLPKPIASEYRINQYPEAQLPTRQMIGDVLTWMTANKLLGAPVTADQVVWTGQGGK